MAAMRSAKSFGVPVNVIAAIRSPVMNGRSRSLTSTMWPSWMARCLVRSGTASMTARHCSPPGNVDTPSGPDHSRMPWYMAPAACPAHSMTRGESNGSPCSREGRQPGDGRGGGEDVAEVGNEDARPEPDAARAVGGPAERDPDVGVERRRVVDPCPPEAQFLGERDVIGRLGAWRKRSRDVHL